MTIRYKCIGCESVLKIKDEKAGTKGKCPKCKLEFTVPFPEEDEDDGIEVEAPAVEDPVDSVDMPIELTPDASESDEFDPLDVLSGPSTTGRSSAGRSSAGPVGSNPADRKPSVAELMRDFEASKKKDPERRPVVSRPAVSAAETVGTAAEALSRAYQQKRDSASAPSKSAKDVKASEQRTLLIDFIKTRAAPGILLVSVVLYSYYWYMNREIYTGPPLFDVTGQIMKNGKPAAGVAVVFEPINGGTEDPRTSSTATSDVEGKYRLIYLNFPGAPAGDYRVMLTSEMGTPISQAGGMKEFRITEKGPNEFKIDI